MIKKTLQALGATAILAFAANAETITEEQRGETLAWILAAYVSCETADEMKIDIEEEIARFEAEAGELLIASNILAEAPQACGPLQGFASKLVNLAADDMDAYNAEYAELANLEDAPVVMVASSDELPDGTTAAFSTDSEGNLVIAQSPTVDGETSESPVTAVASWTGAPSSVRASGSATSGFFRSSNVPMPSGSDLRTTSDYK